MDTDVLARLIDDRCSLLVELHRLARRQADLVQGGDMSRLFSLLAVKQKMLNELVAVDRRLDPFRTEEPEDRVWRCEADRQQCRASAERCEILLREIVGLERACEIELIRRRDRAAELVQGMHGAALANQAYRSSELVPGGQLDVSCES